MLTDLFTQLINKHRAYIKEGKQQLKIKLLVQIEIQNKYKILHKK